MDRITLLTRQPYRDVRVTARRAIRSRPSANAPALGVSSGPLTVRNGLVRGLLLTGQRYLVDPPSWRATRLLGVLSGIDALLWAVETRRRRGSPMLVAGPNIVVLPSDVAKVVDWSVPDKVVVPSAWVRQRYVEDMPSLEGRIEIWSAGVDDTFWRPSPVTNRDIDVLVYEKVHDHHLLRAIQSSLSMAGLASHVLTYGNYTRDEFRALLQRSSAMVFLSESESQGLALFEAWSCNVPTLVWDRCLWMDAAGRRSEYASSAPYLANQNGISFRRSEAFPAALEAFWRAKHEFRPREYILGGHTLEHAARRYVALFQ